MKKKKLFEKPAKKISFEGCPKKKKKEEIERDDDKFSGNEKYFNKPPCSVRPRKILKIFFDFFFVNIQL